MRRRRLRSAPFREPRSRRPALRSARQRSCPLESTRPQGRGARIHSTPPDVHIEPPLPPLVLPPRRRARRKPSARTLLLTGSLALVVGATALCGAALWRPAWYRPAQIDRTRLKADKADFANMLAYISDELNAGRPVTIELDEAQVNRWIAARHELFLDEDLELLDQVPEACVLFLDDQRVRVAGAGRWKGWDCILSATLRLESDPYTVAAHCESVSAGALPVPRAWLPDAGSELRVHGRSAEREGLSARARNEWVWFNGKRSFRLSNLETRTGRLRVTLEPLALTLIQR